MKSKLLSNWLVPFLLLLLGMVTVLFGVLQLDVIWKGPPVEPIDTMYYFEMPIPIVTHIVAGIFLNIIGPLQFGPAVLRRWLLWHRWSGRILIVSGLLVGATGLWMNHFYPAYGGMLKYSGVAAHSLGLIFGLLLALQAIRNGNVPQHRAWMMRAIASGLGPATQRVIIIPLFLILGEINIDWIGLVVWGGLLTNLAVAEWVLWRERQGRPWRFAFHMPTATSASKSTLSAD